MIMFKSRFCPSPTGLMHLGNLRTALFNVLFAKSNLKKDPQSTFLLRIEDTDKVRSQEHLSEQLMSDLLWLDLDWQEGPKKEKGHAPYYQSQRESIYQSYYQQLITLKRAYWCYCTDTELTITRKTQIQAGMAPRYANTCRHLTPEQIAQKEAKGVKPALRFRIPDGEAVDFHDFVQGEKHFSTDDIGDFIIQKADGSASFMFCNAIDDSLMGVTHVLRGEDHLTNTPRQLLILRALSMKAPEYGHMPLILGFDGKPLSKRNGSQSVESLREQGYFPLAILNYLSRLGHHFEKDALMSLDELGEHFSVTHIGRAPARFDLAQLNHWQKETLLKMADEPIWEWMKSHVILVPEADHQNFAHIVRENVLLPAEVSEWAKRLYDVNIHKESHFNLPDARDFLEQLEESEKKEMLSAFAQGCTSQNYDEIMAKVSPEIKKRGKRFYLLVRIALTGRCDGPKLASIFQLMPKNVVKARIEWALAEKVSMGLRM